MKFQGGDNSSGRWGAELKSDGWTEIEVERHDGVWVQGLLDPGAKIWALAEMVEHLRGTEDDVSSDPE